MTDQDNNNLLNSVVISMAHSFLQYVAEAWTWVRMDAEGVEEQVRALAARQRQDVGEIVTLLTQREFAIDFGTFPTEYTDLQFLSLGRFMESLQHGQQSLAEEITETLSLLRASGDDEASKLLETVGQRQKEIATALSELNDQLQATT